MIKETADRYLKFSPLGRKVFDICDAVWRGIYHLPYTVQFNTNWEAKHCIVFNIPYNLATFDGGELSALVILCHDECIRLEINANMRYLKLIFHQRKGRDGSTMERHPTIEESITIWRKEYNSRQTAPEAQ